jgi:ATPase
LQVNAGITQYSKLDGSFDNTADILLLVRPDYTIFDEVRRREDFTTFSDLRLTGVGMVGVIHANSPLDAIQRFIGKIELGIIPNVLDTVVFVNNGDIEKVYDLELKVKVPTGMTESDLARPVIEIRNFENNVLEHEIYTFGDCIASIIGRGGTNINEIEKFLKVHIDVVAKDSESLSLGSDDLPFSFSESKTTLLLTVNREYTSMYTDIYVNNKFFASVRIGKKGQIKIPKRSDIGRNLLNSTSSKNDIQLFLKDF